MMCLRCFVRFGVRREAMVAEILPGEVARAAFHSLETIPDVK